MKKIVAFMLTIVMLFAVCAVAVSATSSDDSANSELLIATLNPVTFDGACTYEKGTSHRNTNTGELLEVGKPHSSEYVFDKKLGKGYVGAAYDLQNGELYIAIHAFEELEDISVTVGGTSYTADLDGSLMEGGSGAALRISYDDFTYEMRIPIKDLKLSEGARGIVSDIKIDTKGESENTFEGKILFSKYAAGFVSNEIFSHVEPILSAGITKNGDGTYSSENTGSGHTQNRESTPILGISNTTKDLVFKFDIKIDSMPVSIPEDTKNDGPQNWGVNETPRIWFALKYRFNETLYGNIQNTPDDDLVLNIMSEYTKDAVVEKKQTTIVLDKELGENMSIELEWSEADANGNCPVNVYVDGILKGQVENGMNTNSQLGVSLGVIHFSTQWTKTDTTLETIKATWGNFYVNELSAMYDEEAYMALIGKKLPSDETPSDDTPTPEDNEPDENTDNAGGEDDAKSGCGSSLAGMGIVASFGAALVTVIAARKKED